MPFTKNSKTFLSEDDDRMTAAKMNGADEAAPEGETSEPEEPGRGPLLDFVLLKKPGFDKTGFLQALRSNWGIEIDPPKEGDEDDAGSSEGDDNPDVIVESVNGILFAVMHFPMPVPDGEAVDNAENNYLWPGAVEAAKAHQAHLAISVFAADVELGEDATEPDPDTLHELQVARDRERAQLFAKVTATGLQFCDGLGVYANGTVMEPQDYVTQTEHLKTDPDLFPVRNLVWIGLLSTEAGLSAFTTGLKYFGYREIEVLDVPEDVVNPLDLLNFTLVSASFVLDCGVELLDGETIGFSEDEKHPITVSPSVNAITEESAKIDYMDGWEGL